MKRAFLFALIAGMFANTWAQTYNEKWRPQYHFTPAKNFMNDPNGLVYLDGEYHLFYQHNPEGNRWGHMSWGHAVSPDMLHWKHLPLAIAERPNYMIYSGSAVIDHHNTSGLCTQKNGCMIAIFTAATDDTWQRQHMAYSNDRGRTWTEYKGNPIADLRLSNFRDPKVFWYAPQNKWVMVAVVAEDRKVMILDSQDLKKFTVRSEFTVADEPKRQWECPDLFELPVEGTNQSKWVMVVNVNPGAPAGGTGTKYFLGSFDGNRFTAEAGEKEALWADYGKDFYATQSFAEMPPGDNRKVWLGWISNWQYANDEPTSPWKGMQSIPRSLKLRRFAEGLRLVQTPVEELRSIEEEPVMLQGSVDELNRKLRSLKLQRSLRITADVDLGAATELGLVVLRSKAEQTVIGIDASMKEIYVDRSRSGEASFSKNFPGRHATQLNNSAKVKLDIFLDRTSIEIFANDGERVLAERVFPMSEDDWTVELFSKGGKPGIQSLRLASMKSVWTER